MKNDIMIMMGLWVGVVLFFSSTSPSLLSSSLQSPLELTVPTIPQRDTFALEMRLVVSGCWQQDK